MSFAPYKHNIQVLSPDPAGDASLALNNDLKTIADFLDGVSLVGHVHSGADITSGTISDSRLSSNVLNAIAATHSPATLGTSNGLSLSGQALSLALATTATAGAMSASDKTKLNGIDLSQYLTLSGGTMEGDVDLNGHDLNNANGICGSYLGSPDTTTNLEMTSDGMIAHVDLSMNGATLDMGGGSIVNTSISTSGNNIDLSGLHDGDLYGSISAVNTIYVETVSARNITLNGFGSVLANGTTVDMGSSNIYGIVNVNVGSVNDVNYNPIFDMSAGNGAVNVYGFLNFQTDANFNGNTLDMGGGNIDNITTLNPSGSSDINVSCNLFFEGTGIYMSDGTLDMGNGEIDNADSIGVYTLTAQEIYCNGFNVSSDGSVIDMTSTTLRLNGSNLNMNENRIVGYTATQHANNAAAIAGGLAVGTMYATSTGEMRVVV